MRTGPQWTLLFFSSRRRHTRFDCDWSSDVCSSDLEAIVRLVYQGRGSALWGLVTPGNRRWRDEKLPHPGRSLDQARALLKEAGFSWSSGSNAESTLLEIGRAHV